MTTGTDVGASDDRAQAAAAIEQRVFAALGHLVWSGMRPHDDVPAHDQVRLTSVQANGLQSLRLHVTDGHRTSSALPPDGCADDLVAYRNLTADPDLGAWTVATFELSVAPDRTETRAVLLDRDRRASWLTSDPYDLPDGPAWRQPLDGDLAADLLRFPRADSAVPEWLRTAVADPTAADPVQNSANPWAEARRRMRQVVVSTFDMLAGRDWSSVDLEYRRGEAWVDTRLHGSTLPWTPGAARAAALGWLRTPMTALLDEVERVDPVLGAALGVRMSVTRTGSWTIDLARAVQLDERGRAPRQTRGTRVGHGRTPRPTRAEARDHAG